MTSEHFVVWLTGFLKGMKFSNEKVPLTSILEEELKKVLIGAHGQFSVNNMNKIFPHGGCEL